MRRLVLLILFIFFLTLPVRAQPRKDLTLWVHPYLPATELTDHFSPLASYLGKALGIPVVIRVQPSYQSHLDFVGRDQADIAFLGPASYVLIHRRYDAKPLLAKLELNGKPFFHGMIIARLDSGLDTLGDLAGKSFAFGDPNSTMAHIVPRGMLQEAGITLNSLQRHDFLYSHQNVALAVLGGYFDAGAVKEEVFHEFKDRGLTMLAQSPPIAEHLFVTRSDLPPELIEKIRFHLLDITRHPEGREILQTMKQGTTDLVPVTDSDYDSLRKIMKSLENE